MAGRPDIARENGKKGGRPKGSKSQSTLAKEEAREVARKLITSRLKPMIDAQVAAAIGTSKLMLRNEDGTWRPATDADDIEAILNGDGNKYWIAPNPPSTAAFNTLMAYAIDKPQEPEQAISGTVHLKVSWLS